VCSQRSHIFPALCAGLPFFAVFMWSATLIDGWHTTKMLYLYAIIPLAFLSITVYYFLKKDLVLIKINIIDICLVLFIGYSFIRLLFTPYAIVTDGKFVILVLLGLLYLIWKTLITDWQKTDSYNPVYLLIAIFILTSLFQGVYGLLQLYNVDPFQKVGYFKVTGTFVNPGPFAGYIASVVPFSLGVYLFINTDSRIKHFVKYSALANVVAGVLLLPATYIRGGWLAVTAGLFFILNYKYRLYETIYTVLKTGFRRALGLALTLLITTVIIVTLYSIKPDSAYGRLLIWEITTEMVKDKPVFGCGFNRYKIDYNNYQASFFASEQRDDKKKWVAGNINHANNEYLQIFAEKGILGIALFLTMLVSVHWGYRKSDKPPPDSPSLETSAILRIGAAGSLISICIIAFFSFPFHIVPTFVNFFFFLSIISACSIVKPYLSSSLTKKHLAFIIITLIPLCTVFVYHSHNQYRTYKEWQNAFNSTLAFSISEGKYRNLHPRLKNNGKFFLNYGAMLTLAGRYDEALPLLEESKKRFTDPNLYIVLAECYENTGNYENAEQHYRHAAYMIPHKLYPFYRLALFYFDNGNKQKAEIIAHRIISMEEKVPSTAVDEIKEEMKFLLDFDVAESSN
jgi:O-antigen polymerase